MNCSDCSYSREMNERYFCYGQKYAPEVNPNSVCDSWKSKYKTIGDSFREKTNEELAIFFAPKSRGCPPDRKYPCFDDGGCCNCWLKYFNKPLKE